MSGIAQLAREQLPNLLLLAERLKLMFEEQELFPEGAIIRLDHQRTVLTSWGMNKRAVNRLLPKQGVNGSQVRVPAGWQLHEIGSTDLPTVIVLNVDPEADDGVSLLMAQIATVWQSVAMREDFTRRERAVTTLTKSLQGLVQQPNVEQFLQTLIDQSTDLLNTSGGGLYLLNPQHNRFELSYISRFPAKYLGTPLQQTKGGLSQVIATGKSLLVNNYQAYPDKVDWADGILITALLAAPIQVDNQVVGVLALIHVNPDRAFSVADVALLESFAAQTSMALRTSRLFDAQRQQARELYVLYENSRTAGSSLDLQHILERLTENVVLALNIEQSAVLLWDESRQHYTLAAYAADEQTNDQVIVPTVGSTYGNDAGSILRTVNDSQQPVSIANVRNDPRSKKQRAWFVEGSVNSLLAVPMTIRDQFLGVLLCTTLQPRRVFTPSEITLAQTLASQAANAIGNTRLLADERRRTHELTILRELSSEFNAGITLSTAIDAISASIRKLMDNIELEFCLYDGQTQQLQSVYISDTHGRLFTKQASYYTLDQGLTGWLARHQVPLRIGDMSQQRTYVPANVPTADFRSFLGVPMLVGDELIGTIELASHELNHFDSDDERLLTIIASQSAQAIRNLRRYEATDEVLRERVRELLAIQRISRELTSTLHLEQLLPTMLQEVIQATSSDHGAVALYDENDELQIVAHTGYPSDVNIEATFLPLLKEEHLAEDRDHTEAVIFDDLATLEVVPQIKDIRSLLYAPIVYENQVAGMILASSLQPFAFDHAAFDFVRAVADQAALAIGNAQHYAEQVKQRELLQQRASLLNEVLEIGNALRADMELSNLLEQIAFSITEAAGFREVVFSLIDAEQPTMLRTVAGAGLSISELEERRKSLVPIAALDTFLDSQYRIGRVYYVPADPDPAIDTWQIGDKLIVPLYSTERELIGVFVVDDPFTNQRPNRRIAETLEIFANQAAIAIENARLFSQRSRQIAELDIINRISRAATTSLDFSALSQQVYNVLSDLMPMTAFYIALLDDQAEHVVASWVMDQGVAVPNALLGSIHAESMMDWIVTNKKSLHFSDLANDLAQHPTIELKTLDHASGKQMPASIIGVPLLLGDGTVRGVLSIQHTENGRYSQHDADLLETIANQLAVGVSNARLFSDAQQRLQELALINQIGSLTSSKLDVVEILQGVYESIRHIFPLDVFYSFVYDHATKQVVQRVNVERGINYISANHEQLKPTSPSAWIIDHCEPLIFHDMTEEIQGRFEIVRFGDPKYQVKSWIGVPLKISDGTAIGVLSIQHYDPDKYQHADMTLLQTVASQVALALQNARLFSDREQQIRELDAISSIGQLISASMNLNEMLQRTSEALLHVTGAPVFYAMIYDRVKQEMVDGYAVQEGIVAQETPRGPLRPNSMSEWVIKHHAPLIMHDIQDVVECASKQIQPILNSVPGNDASPRSFVGVPIQARDGAPIGMLSLQSYETKAFDHNTAGFLTSVVSHISLGLQKIQLFNERDRQIKELEAIRQVGQVVNSSLDAKTIMQGVYTVIKQFMPIEGFLLSVFDPETHKRTAAFVMDGDEEIQMPLGVVPEPATLTDWILHHRQPLLFSNFVEEIHAHSDISPNYLGENDDTPQSWLGVPLIANTDQAFGMLAVLHYQPNSFDQRDQALLSNVAYQVALGMQNVWLYQQSQTSMKQLATEAERLRLINRVSSMTAEETDVQTIYEIAVREMVRATNASQARLIIVHDDSDIGTTQALYPPGDMSVTIQVKGNQTFAWMEEHRRPLIINEPYTNPMLVSLRDVFRSIGIDAVMIVPLMINDQLIGSIGIDYINTDQKFTESDAESCQIIANQVSQALQRSNLFAETQRQANVLSHKVGELSVLLQAGQALSSLHEPSQVLDTLVRLVARQLNIETVLLSTLTHDDYLQPAASLGLPDDFLETMRIKRGEGLIGTVAERAQPMIVSDVQREVSLSQHPDFNQEHGLTSFLGVPVRYRSQLLGVLSVMAHGDANFSDDNIALLSALADQAAIALENTRLFAERERQITVLQALNDVTQAISSTLDTQALVRELHSRLASVVDTRFSFIAFYDQERNLLSFPVVMNNGHIEDREPLPLAEGALSRIVRDHRTINLGTVDETTGASRLVFDSDEPMASWLGIPINLADQVLGVINVQSTTPHAFAPDTVQFLQAVASQTAIALENAHLFTERERQVAEAAILSTISQSMTATLTPEELASSILNGLESLLDTKNAYIVFYDAPTNMVTTTTGFSNSVPFTLGSHPLTNDFLKSILFEQRPLLFKHHAELEAEQLNSDVVKDDARFVAIQAESVIAAAITMGSQTSGMLINQPLGAIVVQSLEPNAFTHQQLRFLESVANQASGAVQKAVLFNERERRIRELDTLNRISQAITSTIDLDEMLSRLYQGLGEIVNMATASIGLYDSQTHMMEYNQVYDRGTPISLSPRVLRTGISRWVADHRQPLLLNTREEADEYRDKTVSPKESSRAVRTNNTGELEQSFLVVPIIVGNDVQGIINIQSYDQHAFSEYDMSFVMTVAGQAGAAIANARLFAQRERSIQQLRQLNLIGQALGSTVRVEDLYQVIYQQTGSLANTQNFYLAIYDERNQIITFPLCYERGEPVQLPNRKIDNGLTAYVIRSRRPLLLQGEDVPAQVAQHNIQVVGEMPLSWLGIPLIATDKVVGVMAIQDYENENTYTEDAVQLLSTIAGQAAQALENARLYSDSRESVRELSVLSDTSVSLASTLDMEELLSISASSALEMARADFGGVIVLEPDGYTINTSLLLDRDLAQLDLPLSETFDMRSLHVLRPLRSASSVTLVDTTEDPVLARFTTPLSIRGATFLPILNEQMLRGVVFVGMREPHTFDERTVASLSILSSQIGQSVNKAQMFNQIRSFNTELEQVVDKRTSELKDEKERVEALYNIATELGTTLDRDELLLRTLDLAAKALNVGRGAVFLQDRESKDMVCHAVLNEELGLKPIEKRVKFDKPGLIEWVIDNNEGVIINDVREDSRWTSSQTGRGDDVRSVIAVPLLSSDAPQGVLMLNSLDVDYFSPDHLRFLSTIGGEVSSALHNADLYTLVFESADRLSEAMWQQREEASKTSAILQSVSEGVVVLDHETGRVILYNPAAEEVLRIPRNDVMGESLLVFASPRNEQELHEEGRALVLYTGLNEGIQHVRKSDVVHRSLLELPGQVIAANFAPVNAEDGSRFGVVMVLRDITREIEADRAKRDFIATVSHELRTPLTPIRGFVDLLMLGAVGELNESQREMLNTIKTNTLRMVSLVEDLLEIGRLEAGKIMLNISAANINHLVRDTVAMWNLELSKKDMKLSLELDDTLPLIEYDSKRVGQVLTNLVSNAIKYTYAGGSVTIRSFRNDDNLIQVDVTDSGVGLTPDQQKNLFRRFYRADSPLRDEVGGTGLGLSIAKSFIELHHGEMWVQSVYGEGSTFSFTLPEHQRPDLGESDEATMYA